MSSNPLHFYEDDSIFIDSLSDFVGAAMGSGGACVVITTFAHRRKLERSLRANFIDTRRSASEGRYVALDAGEILSQLMVNHHPDPARFRDSLEPIFTRARESQRRETNPPAVFGEMVAVLWERGNREAAIELEHLWNDLAIRLNLNLHSTYPPKSFSKEGDRQLFREMREHHAEGAPKPRYGSLRSVGERIGVTRPPQQNAPTIEAAVEEREKEVAHRKVVEERLRRNEEFTRNIIESSVDCVKVFDLEGRIQFMSPAGQRALEITDASAYLNKNWVNLWKEEDRQRAEETLAIARAGGVGCFQGDAVTPSGITKTWDVRITPARGRKGEIERLVAVSRDTTELRNAQRLAIEAEKLAAAGRMAATIAHEINNPLEAVTNFIYLSMISPGVPDNVRHHLEVADRELARVAQIAQQTLGFYRDHSTDRWIGVADLVRDVLIVYERKLAYKRLETRVSVHPDLKLRCKHGELRQALSNLVANAIDASRHGGRIWLRARKSSHRKGSGQTGVRISLADNGAGMSPEVQKRVFVPFFTTKAEIGTGIGLWATRTLIEQHGGSMRFRSRQGEKAGTVMSLFIPHARSREAQIAAIPA